MRYNLKTHSGGAFILSDSPLKNCQSLFRWRWISWRPCQERAVIVIKAARLVDGIRSSGNPYISMQIDVGLGPFRVNAVQTKEARATQSGEFEIIPLVSNGLMKSGSISGELTAMDADNAFTGYIANMMFDLEFMLIENSYKTEETHPDYRIEVSSPRGTPIRVGSAWMAKSSRTGNDYLSLLINTPDGDLRVNAVQNEEQRGGQTFSIIPFIDSGEQPQDAGKGLSLVA